MSGALQWLPTTDPKLQGLPALTTAQIDKVKSWINAGALNN